VSEDLESKEQTSRGSDKNADLIASIRRDYRHFSDYWKDGLADAEVCMRFASGDAFSAKERDRRKNRPCETPDVLSQFVKQTTNAMRQNKRDGKITPANAEATSKDAAKREAVLRGLNYRGNYQACFQTAYEAAVWCGFGYFGIQRVEIKKGIFEPRPRRIANQFSVLLDPYAKEADFSDMKKCFVIDIMRIEDFEQEFPNAPKRSWQSEGAKIAPDWVLGDEIVVAEAWRIKDNGNACQYLTNGFDILEEDEWEDHPWIPVIPVLGEEIYVRESGRTKRKFLSLISRARAGQKTLAFLTSQEIEEFGMSPRAPFIGYKGQFTSPDWATINTKPKPYIEVEALPDPSDPQKVLPLPTRPQYVPQAQAYEIAGEAQVRRVQAAVGVMPLPTAAARQNEKSGIALERIQTQEAIGSFHFVDNGDRAHTNYTRQMNRLISKTMISPRYVGTRGRDDKDDLLFIATEAHKDKIPGHLKEEDVLFVDRGEFDETVTIGPSYDSQRQEASSFVDTLLQNIQALPVPPQLATKILSLAIKLKNIGPLGDEIAKLLDPEEGDPMQQAQKLMAQAAQQQQVMTEMQGELQKLKLEKAGKQWQMQTELEIEKMKHQLEIAKLDNQRAIAEIQTKAQIATERASQLAEVEKELHGSAHEAAMQAAEHQHESQMADKNAVIAQAAAEQAAQSQNGNGENANVS
jgi:hypothetical protein